MAETEAGRLTAAHTLEYPYRRSVGPVLGAFFSALTEQKIVGVKARDGRVLVPPVEYDPETGESIDEIVPVGPGGVVTTWAWVEKPRPKHPLDKPFAWALVKLDGAGSGMLHAVDAGSAAKMRTGMRVMPRWKDTPEGNIHDIVCFEPEAR
jgi:uncharacterized OB-fold protein